MSPELADRIEIFLGRGLKRFGVAFGRENILTAEEVAAIRAIENILLVGNPNGLLDEANNRPIYIEREKGYNCIELKNCYRYNESKPTLHVADFKKFNSDH